MAWKVSPCSQSAHALPNVRPQHGKKISTVKDIHMVTVRPVIKWLCGNLNENVITLQKYFPELINPFSCKWLLNKWTQTTVNMLLGYLKPHQTRKLNCTKIIFRSQGFQLVFVGLSSPQALLLYTHTPMPVLKFWGPSSTSRAPTSQSSLVCQSEISSAFRTLKHLQLLIFEQVASPQVVR